MRVRNGFGFRYCIEVSLFGVMVLVTASCGRSNHVTVVKKLASTEPPGSNPSANPTPTAPTPTVTGKPPIEEPVTEPFTIFDGTCTNNSIDYYGQSRRVSLRIYPKGICPANQNEKTAMACLTTYPFVMEREFFQGGDCKGIRNGSLMEFFTLPEEKGAVGDGVAINAFAGPTFLRVEGDALLARYKDSQFCGVAWALNQNAEVSGMTCGMNDAFLAEKTPIYSLWKKSEAVINLAPPSRSEADRAKNLNDAMIFKIR